MACLDQDGTQTLSHEREHSTSTPRGHHNVNEGVSPRSSGAGSNSWLIGPGARRPAKRKSERSSRIAEGHAPVNVKENHLSYTVREFEFRVAWPHLRPAPLAPTTGVALAQVQSPSAKTPVRPAQGKARAATGTTGLLESGLNGVLRKRPHPAPLPPQRSVPPFNVKPQA